MSKKKLLVVDDDPDQMRGMVIRLKASGYDVLCANDGFQAISAASKEKPDLILLDIGLPGGDGHVVMERLQVLTAASRIPIIVLSAKDPQSHRERAMKSGATAFLQKPTENSALLAAIRQALADSDDEVQETA